MAAAAGGARMMPVFRTAASFAHDPALFFRRGRMIQHPESAERFRVLEGALAGAGYALAEPADRGETILEGVHADDYVQFLKHAWARRAEVDADAEELLTTQFSRVQMNRRPGGLAGQLGFYTADTSTPIRHGTWSAVYGTAQAAAAAADAAGAAGFAYALCRPPGHHAFADCAGGFCYVNNTAVAAQRLRATGARRVAVLDVDVHHGNGTQGVFYRRADVLTVSLHADTSNYFPWFSGYADETGEGAGEGFNLNLPIAHGRGDEDFLAAVRTGLDRIAAASPDALVVALGLDAAEDDPLGVLNVTTDGFARAAEAIAAYGLPTAIVQEGGYLCEALPRNLLAFLGAFEGRHPGLRRG
ncbi:histone deacetylase family protein [Caulobacter sp. KR2-114]|uniref:histone deacetylase family protein n=1 Tax=Caulobacter sp. KR2-114 TaxID=3400912 RepID=UPI003C10A007